MAEGLAGFVLLSLGIIALCAGSFAAVFVAIWWEDMRHIFDGKWYLVPVLIPLFYLYAFYRKVLGFFEALADIGGALMEGIEDWWYSLK